EQLVCCEGCFDTLRDAEVVLPVKETHGAAGDRVDRWAKFLPSDPKSGEFVAEIDAKRGLQAVIGSDDRSDYCGEVTNKLSVLIEICAAGVALKHRRRDR